MSPNACNLSTRSVHPRCGAARLPSRTAVSNWVEVDDSLTYSFPFFIRRRAHVWWTTWIAYVGRDRSRT